jgi:SAM-dependent methyltransferase
MLVLKGGILLDSIEYYNSHSEEYYENTININMQEFWDRFTQLLPDGGSVLDLGCGSGRDSAYFISQGFDVTALDGSKELCHLASIHIGQEVLNLKFSEIDFDEVFDGIWANASLLHVPRIEMESVLSKVIKSMKVDGILYMSFRYGDGEEMEDGRYFTNFRTKSLKDLINKFHEIELIEIRKSHDVLPDRDTIWLYALVRKVSN